ncbi:alpha/beta fold hydrolase [Nocardiopsis coralliicola]
MPVPLQYRLDGPADGPAVLLVPPFGTSWAVWEPQMPELTRTRRVVRLNHRGHGASPAPEGACALGDLGADVAAVLDAAGIESADVVAAGLGTLPAAWLAVHRPERVRRIALVAGAARVPHAAALAALGERARAHGMAAVRATVGQPWFTPAFERDRPDVVRSFAADTASIAPEGFAACCAAAASADLFPRIGQMRAAALVVSGAHDPFLPPGHGRRLAAGITSARFELLRGAAHLATVERPDRINEAIAAHIGV